MNANELKDVIFNNPKAQFSDFTIVKADELLSGLDCEYFASLMMNLELDSSKQRKNGFYGLETLAFYVKETLEQVAKEEAAQSRIKNFKESRLQELALLEKFYFKRATQNMPLWFKEFCQC